MPTEQETKKLGSKQVVLDLQHQLAGAEGAEHQAETAIAVYKAAAGTIDQLRTIQESALEAAARDMGQREVRSLETPVGRAGWDPDTGTFVIE